MATFKELISGPKPVLVDFHAQWCSPCRAMHPVLEQLKQQLRGDALILKMDVDRNPSVAAHYEVTAVPTLILFKNGHIRWRQSGLISASDLAHIIEQHA